MVTSVTSASSPVIVNALSERYGYFNPLTAHLGKPCGEVPASDVTMSDLVASILPQVSTTRHITVSKVYGLAPVSEFWDCFDVGTVLAVTSDLRTPCACKEAPSTNVISNGIRKGLKLGLGGATGFLMVGVTIDSFMILKSWCGGGERGSFFPFQPPPPDPNFGPLKKVNMLCSAGMQLLDEITDIQVLISFFKSTRFTQPHTPPLVVYMYAPLAIPS